MRNFISLLAGFFLTTTGTIFAAQPGLIVGKIKTIATQGQLSIAPSIAGDFKMSSGQRDDSGFVYTITPLGPTNINLGSFSMYMVYSSSREHTPCSDTGNLSLSLGVVNGRIKLITKPDYIVPSRAHRLPSCGVKSFDVNVTTIDDKSVLTITANQSQDSSDQ
ncbi:MAG TPA: hypothetical protein VLJ15_07320 [Gammaproteobacteria bacterium]|nr:hypothetical protein [Gammaproteobacteria bacterium]